MSNLSNFKEFVKQNPPLVKFVKSGEMSWQKFYELFDIYGDKEEIWKPYLKEETVEDASTFDFMNWIKNIDMDSLQENINSIKRVIGVFQDLGENTKKEDTKPIPLYKHFED